MSAWTNYHSHTKYCDGAENPGIFIEKAMDQGLAAFGFSAHAPVNFHTDWCVPDAMLKNYISDIKSIREKYRNRIQIYHGLEIDYIPGISGRSKHLCGDLPLDFFIGSIHFVDSFPDGRRWNIDATYDFFLEGLSDIFKGDGKKAVIRFYELTREMIEVDRPDVIGHLDKIKMFNAGGEFFNENETWYKDQVNLTLDVIKRTGGIVEVNTRGYYKYGQSDLYPGDWIIAELARREVPVMINSDAHHSSEIIKGMPYAASKLKALNVKTLSALYNDKWGVFSFSEDGIDFE